MVSHPVVVSFLIVFPNLLPDVREFGFGTSDFGFRGSGARQFIWRAFSYILPSVPQFVFIDKRQKLNLIFLLLFYTMGREKAIFFLRLTGTD